MIKEDCGVVGISLQEDSPLIFDYLYYALYTLQHRGQESAGIAINNKEGIFIQKGMGLVSEVFNKKRESIKGDVGIGHVRYSTSGESNLENCQPSLIEKEDELFILAHNGNIVNYKIIKKELESKGHIINSSSDSEIIGHLFIERLKETHDITGAVARLMEELKGAYSVVMLYKNKIVAFRDPLGIRPLCIGELYPKGLIIASESVAIDTLNGRLIRDIKPGEVVILEFGNIIEEKHLVKLEHNSHCMFEYVYFARPDSVIDGRSVYEVRMAIGKLLAQKAKINADFVSPMPDSGVTFAIGYAISSGLPYIESLIKNRYVGRTFIIPNQEERELMVKIKLNPIRNNIDGKRIVLVDDSIVRGTTSKRVVNILRKAGAKEVHLCIGCPPLISPCYFGVDFTTNDELVASQKNIAEISKIIGADSITYASIDDIVKAINIERDDLCISCLTGIYHI
ncbi:amidophosphoribosyltransferase [Candidatus Methanoliparum sp. LAM-1]|uniref:amidophosphoribosyltransferase n=1 Tax=Candidatus Methanoliparum sp. LAM-1 TaxID=2874846 RepID=UPI001E3ED2E5|nr:amidophosphoribosyltransferase [Candidatus Methanoliparum sp. LAM-1]BDC36376.1 amidophosphoribosyltransferase [Candidatus Methanoliparum sp. LAM-1]